jgi:hypothetical protein
MSNVRSIGDGKGTFMKLALSKYSKCKILWTNRLYRTFLGLSDYPESQTHKKMNSRRREPRRHTLQNGIDCNMVKIESFGFYICSSYTPSRNLFCFSAEED